jgi:hypothetical protein
MAELCSGTPRLEAQRPIFAGCPAHSKAGPGRSSSDNNRKIEQRDVRQSSGGRRRRAVVETDFRPGEAIGSAAFVQQTFSKGEAIRKQSAFVNVRWRTNALQP